MKFLLLVSRMLRLPCAVSIFGMLVISYSVGVIAQDTFTLITTEEYKQSEALGVEPNVIELKTFEVTGPAIVLEAPSNIKIPLESPLDIVLRLSTSEDAKIDLDTLKIRYGSFLRLDITERIMEHAVIDGDVVEAKGAELPEGKHKIYVSVSDSEGRKVEEKYVVVIR